MLYTMRREVPVLPSLPKLSVRDAIGQSLRNIRKAQGKTLRDVCGDSSVSIGHLSEVERGCKEVSSEILSSICIALDVSPHKLLREAADLLELSEVLSNTPTHSIQRKVLR